MIFMILNDVDRKSKYFQLFFEGNQRISFTFSYDSEGNAMSFKGFRRKSKDPV